MALQVVTDGSGLASLAGWAGSGSDVFRWARCASWILGSGSMLLAPFVVLAGKASATSAGAGVASTAPNEGGAARVAFQQQLAAMGGATRVACQLAEQQLAAMHALMAALAATQPEQQRTLAAWAGSVAKPAQLLGWLELAAKALCLAHNAGLALDTALPPFASIASQIMMGEPFRKHQAALKAAPQQQAQVAALLLPLSRAATQDAAQLGSDSAGSNSGSDSSGSGNASSGSGSGSGSSLPTAVHYLKLLTANSLKQGVQTQLQGSQGIDLLTATAGLVDLVARLPHTAGGADATVWNDHCNLLLTSTVSWAGFCKSITDMPQLGGGLSGLQRRATWYAALQLESVARMASKLHAAGQVGAHETRQAAALDILASLQSVAQVVSLDRELLASDPHRLARGFAGSVQAAAAAALFSGIAPSETMQALTSCVQAAYNLVPSSTEQLPTEDAGKWELVVQLRSVHAAACRLAHHLEGVEGENRDLVEAALCALTYSFLSMLNISRMCNEGHFPSRELQASAAAHVNPAAVLMIKQQAIFVATCPPTKALADAVALCTPWLWTHECEEALVGEVRTLLSRHQEAAATGSAVVGGMVVAASGGSGLRGMFRASICHLAVAMTATAAAAPRIAASLLGSDSLSALVTTFLRLEPQRQHVSATERAQEQRRFKSQVFEVHQNLHQLVSALGRAVQDAAAADVAAGAEASSSPVGRIPADVLAAAAQMGAAPPPLPQDAKAARTAVQSALARLLPVAKRLAAALQAYWQQPRQQEAAALELAKVAATRGCAHLRCANLGAQGGPDCGQVAGSKRCGGCRVVRYCCTDCQTADWRGGGHRKVCAALKALREAGAGAAGAREAAQQAQQQQL